LDIEVILMEIWIIGIMFSFFYCDMVSGSETIESLGWVKVIATIFFTFFLLVFFWPALCGIQLRLDFKRL